MKLNNKFLPILLLLFISFIYSRTYGDLVKESDVVKTLKLRQLSWGMNFEQIISVFPDEDLKKSNYIIPDITNSGFSIIKPLQLKSLESTSHYFFDNTYGLVAIVVTFPNKNQTYDQVIRDLEFEFGKPLRPNPSYDTYMGPDKTLIYVYKKKNEFYLNFHSSEFIDIKRGKLEKGAINTSIFPTSHRYGNFLTPLIGFVIWVFLGALLLWLLSILLKFSSNRFKTALTASLLTSTVVFIVSYFLMGGWIDYHYFRFPSKTEIFIDWIVTCGLSTFILKSIYGENWLKTAFIGVIFSSAPLMLGYLIGISFVLFT